uniref:Uncharacterized protein n=1 Tax=Knipowitschia caucasica TaxID=637954 RepID=A0AAV2MLE4_KNICA
MQTDISEPVIDEPDMKRVLLVGKAVQSPYSPERALFQQSPSIHRAVTQHPPRSLPASTAQPPGAEG